MGLMPNLTTRTKLDPRKKYRVQQRIMSYVRVSAGVTIRTYDTLGNPNATPEWGEWETVSQHFGFLKAEKMAQILNGCKSQSKYKLEYRIYKELGDTEESGTTKWG